MELLRNQIHPHFLFNTLHAISELMHEDVEAADKMLTRLAELLRASLKTSGTPQVTLRDELGTLDRYIAIERVRLGDRLRYESTIDPQALDRLVPNFLLQPLVENSIRHAIVNRREGGSIDVHASLDDAKLIITIDDDGPGLGADHVERVGLGNVRARLEQMYGSAARFDIASGQGSPAGTHIRIEIPQ